MELQNRIETFWDTVKDKDTKGIASAYVPKEDTYVILEGPRFSTMGFSKIMKGWEDFCGSTIDMLDYNWFEGPYEEIDGNIGWIGGIVDLSIGIGDKEFTNRFRCTFVMKRVDKDWKIRHEHVSAPMEDPYGVGDWLKKV